MLYDRVRSFVTHVGKVQYHLNGAAEAYNKAIGSYTRLVRPKGERLRELGAMNKPELEDIEELDKEALPAPGAGAE